MMDVLALVALVAHMKLRVSWVRLKEGQATRQKKSQGQRIATAWRVAGALSRRDSRLNS